jgi:multidrug efflux pump subunit AcrB
VFSLFFINRPIFASVLSIVITLAGAIAVFTLPVTQYPEITPPTVEVSASYPGANAQVVADTVAAPIEQQVNGVENMMYMHSQCTNDGNYSLTITFKVGTDLNIAQVLVQNRVTLATPILPDLVKRKGILVKKKSPSVLMIVNLWSPDGSRDSLYLSNYATIQLRDELARLPGIGDITYLGQRDYSMRLWLDPGKLAARNLSAGDVVNAISQQNAQVAAGQIGQPPVPPGQVFQYTMTTLGRLATPKQFEDMTIKTGADGRLVKMRDVVRENKYAVRLRLDPGKLAKLGITPAEALASLDAVGITLEGGPDAGAPEASSPSTDPLEHLLLFPGLRPPSADDVAGRLVPLGSWWHWVPVRELAAAGGIERVLRHDELGVELGALSYDQTCTLDGKPSVALSVYQLPGSNALETARLVRAKMEELRTRFPSGLDYSIVYDTTPFITESINEVFHTLRDAVILVAFVVLLFLQNWRSAVIPLVAVPVAIIGTFAVMAAAGFSLNNLTLFGLVLAIGIVVDDAIVVVEAVEHHIEHGMSPHDATARAMQEVSGPVVAVGLVLTAVFVPCAFIAGITGQFYRQFALTIAVSTVISAFNSLTLSPALCALLLKPRHATKHRRHEVLPRHGIAALFGLGAALILPPYLGGWFEQTWQTLAGQLGEALLLWLVRFVLFLLGYGVGLLLSGAVNAVLGATFRWFNLGFERATVAYVRAVGGLLRVSLVVLLLYGGLLFLTYWGFTHTPTGFIPQQDKGYLLLNVQLPDAASVERTEEVMRRIEGLANETPGVRHTVAIAGQSLLLGANSPNFGSMYVMLEEFHDRPALARALRDEARARLGRWPFDDPRALESLRPEDLDRLKGWLARERQRLQRRADRQVPEKDHVGKALQRLARARLGKWPLAAPDRVGPGELELVRGWFRAEAQRLREEAELDLSGDAIAARLQRRLQAEVEEGISNVFGAPPVEGLGTAGGFKIIVEDRGDNGPEALQEVTEKVAEAGNAPGDLEGIYSSFRANTPWLYLNIDRGQAKTMNVSMNEVFNTLQVYLGSYYVNDFNRFGRTWQVNVQADTRFRRRIADLKLIKVRRDELPGAIWGTAAPVTGSPGPVGMETASPLMSAAQMPNQMVPFATLMSVEGKNGPVMVVRYNMYPAAAINGQGAAGVSSGQAIERMQERVQEQLPQSMRYEWTELALLQLQTGNTAMLVFILAVVLVFLVLAAQYESWALPLAVILVVPMCLLCSIAGVALAHMDINIFTQIGFVVLVGLACKNAILIVEFAKARREQGVPRREATLQACRLRLRPIMMTSFAFILGVVPLVISEGAGAEMRRTLGTAVFSGMLGVTLFGIFLTPVFYYVIQFFGDWRAEAKAREAAEEEREEAQNPAQVVVAQPPAPTAPAAH